VQASLLVTGAAKIELGIIVPADKSSARPAPDFAPKLSVKSVDGRRVTLNIGTLENPIRMPLEFGVTGATILSFVGPDAPPSPAACKYERSTSRSSVEVLFPESIQPGTQVWLMAFFFNARQHSGPACNAVPVTINYPTSAPMRMAIAV